MKIDTALSRKLVRWWHVSTIIASTTVGWLALELPQYRDELGAYGGFILIGVKLVDLWINALPKLLPPDDTDQAGA